MLPARCSRRASSAAPLALDRADLVVAPRQLGCCMLLCDIQSRRPSATRELFYHKHWFSKQVSHLRSACMSHGVSSKFGLARCILSPALHCSSSFCLQYMSRGTPYEVLVEGTLRCAAQLLSLNRRHDYSACPIDTHISHGRLDLLKNCSSRAFLPPSPIHVLDAPISAYSSCRTFRLGKIHDAP